MKKYFKQILMNKHPVITTRDFSAPVLERYQCFIHFIVTIHWPCGTTHGVRKTTCGTLITQVCGAGSLIVSPPLCLFLFLVESILTLLLVLLNELLCQKKTFVFFFFPWIQIMKTLRYVSEKAAVKCVPWTQVYSVLITVWLTPWWLHSTVWWCCVSLVRKQLLTI